MKEILYYTTKEGKCPFYEQLQSLDNITKHRIEQRIYIITEGNYGDCKPLKNSELSEFRFITNKGYRIYYKELDNVIILIIAGGDKSNQNQVINKANKYYEEFKERYFSTNLQDSSDKYK